MEPLRTPLRLHRGVTVVEMLVVLGIIGILSIIVVLSQRTFNRSILVNYTAYDVALTIRSAETFGLSSRVTNQISAQTGYGVYFHRDANPNGFVMFADSDPVTPPNGSCHFDTGTTVVSGSPDTLRGDCLYKALDKIVNAYSFGNGMKFAPSGTCVFKPPPAGRGWECEYPSLAITFARPNTKVYFAWDGKYDSAITKARIILTSSQGTNATFGYICIDQSGAIKVLSRPGNDNNACS